MSKMMWSKSKIKHYLCLRCNRKFRSEGFHNRICSGCNYVINDRSQHYNYIPESVIEDDASLITWSILEIIERKSEGSHD